MKITFKPGALDKVREANVRSRASGVDLERIARKYNKDGMRVLDVGIHGDIWPGGHAHLFNNAKYETIDIDPYVNPTHVGDIRDLQFEDETWDCIFCIAVMEHVLNEREKAYEELYRVLKKGGTLAYVIPKYLDREVEASSFVSRTKFEEHHEDKDYHLGELSDNTYLIEVWK